MAAASAGACALIALVLLPSVAALLPSSLPAALALERAVPPICSDRLGRLRDRNRARHRVKLQTFDGVVDFPVKGNSDPSLFGLDFGRVRLGTPLREFYVQIDTGSDLLSYTDKTVNCS